MLGSFAGVPVFWRGNAAKAKVLLLVVVTTFFIATLKRTHVSGPKTLPTPFLPVYKSRFIGPWVPKGA